MPSPTFEIDTRRTFAALVIMGTSKRTKYGTGETDTAADGRPKWQVDIAATWIAEPGRRAVSDVLPVTIVADADPAATLALPCAVELEGLRLGVSQAEKNDKGRVQGGRPWYQAEAVRAVNGHRPAVKAE